MANILFLVTLLQLYRKLHSAKWCDYKNYYRKKRRFSAKSLMLQKVFADYFNNKSEDQKKQDLVNAENKAKQAAIEAEAKELTLKNTVQ